MKPKAKPVPAAFAATLLLAVMTGCGGETTGGITVEGAWARSSAAVASAGAAYLEITNNGEADALVGASVDPSVAATVEIHETLMMAGTTGDMGSPTTGGMMTMQPVDEIALPSGETVSLEPGGYHVMLLDLAAPLETGSTITITLSFANADDLTVTADVLETAP